MVFGLLSNTILAATVAPHLELYAALACCVHKPEVAGVDTYSPLCRGVLISPSFTIAVDDTVDRMFKRAPPTILKLGSNPYSSDPAVQSAAAKINTGLEMIAVSTLTEILTIVTVGWWSSFSDRYGRKTTMGIAAIGQLISSLNFLFAAKYVEQIPGGYWLLVVDAVISGIFGGATSKGAAMFAYVSDISTTETRSRLFSVLTGFFLAGVGIGPMLGGLIVWFTHNLLSVLYMAAAFRTVQTFFVWFILPESLPPAQMQRALVNHQEISVSTDDHTPLFGRLVFF
ncbi:major facilitator superfamily domain-containing protein [Mycena rosella]|uniref:Major facilitator superfamily domain-containing protein n=1 Tax=Mycena rosella TaxID=1033263 RepID=A0AAD7DTE7_MYCRO|nr:major facilitator superfamily domain-containing protein [Mycena rosella]